MDVDAFLALSPRAFRERVPSLVSGPIDDAVVAATIEQELTEFIGSFSDADIASILDAVANIGAEWRPYDAHPLIRRAGRIWSRHVLAGSALEGLEHLITAKRQRAASIALQTRVVASPEEVEAAWREEIARRVKSLEDGTAVLTPGAGATPRVGDAAWASQMATGAGSAENSWHVQPTVRSLRTIPP